MVDNSSSWNSSFQIPHSVAWTEIFLGQHRRRTKPVITAESTSMKLSTLRPNSTAADIAEVTYRDGGAIVRNVLSQDLLDRINAELDPYLDQIAPESPDGYSATTPGTKTQRLEGLVQKSDAVVEVILDDRFQLWVYECLDWAGELQLSSAQLIDIGPGEPSQIPHRDEDSFPQIAGGDNEIVVSCTFALSDITEEVGSPRIAPGSHRDQWLDPATLDMSSQTVPVEMHAGDALFFTGKVIHGGGANTTTNRRCRGLTITFTLGWLKPEEALLRSVSRERAMQLPPRMRELCGFAGYRILGPGTPQIIHRLDMRDPYRVIFGEDRPTYD
jgi:hypothetical protein